MSDDDLEAVRGVYAAFAKGDLAAATELFADDILFEPMSDGRQAFVGLEAVGRQMREFLSHWEDFRVEAEEFRRVGDSIVVTERQRGRGKASGVETESTFYAVWTFRGGSAVRVRWETDEAAALSAARQGV